MGVHTVLILVSRELVNTGISYLADNIIYLFYAQEGHELKKFIGVLKMRGSTHEKTIQEFTIEKAGPEVMPSFFRLTAGFNLQMSEKNSFLAEE